MLHDPRTHSPCQDGYAECFARARKRLEGWMRGDPLDVAQLARDLRCLPDNVCRTLLCGVPLQLSDEVLAAVRELRLGAGASTSAT